MNHSTRSLPCLIGKMYSSVVGQHRMRPHTDETDGFHVTSERDKYANKLMACTSFSNPGSACTSDSFCGTSAKARLTGNPLASVRSSASPASPGIRLHA